MHLPEHLQLAIEAEIEISNQKEILEARKDLTERYRNKISIKGGLMASLEHRLSYLVTRMPATFSSLRHVFQELKRRQPLQPIKSLLDLGAGPGTAMWAATEVLEELETVTLFEKDSDLISIGKRLAQHSEKTAINQAIWEQGDLEHIQKTDHFDLITLSYSIGELPFPAMTSLIDKCWNLTNHFLVVIEPGTPAGFERIKLIRTRLIELGAFITAPCPHANVCPMGKNDWCHFSERVERTALHRKLKEGALGYEDEKFSYIIVSKTPCELPKGRIIRHPIKHSGHLSLTLCTENEIKQTTISKKNGEDYKKAKKSCWGDSFP